MKVEIRVSISAPWVVLKLLNRHLHALLVVPIIRFINQLRVCGGVAPKVFILFIYWVLQGATLISPSHKKNSLIVFLTNFLLYYLIHH